MTLSQARKLAATETNTNTLSKVYFGDWRTQINIPDSFDCRKRWEGCVNDVVN
jgi:hypothetical protein